MDDTSNTATARQTLAERYGTDRPTRRPLIVVAVTVLALVLLAWLVWAAWVQATPDVRGGLSSYHVVSEHAVTVQIEVRRGSGDAVTCTVQALAEDHAVVGDDAVTIPAGAAGDVSFEATVTTDRRATTATVSDCR